MKGCGRQRKKQFILQKKLALLFHLIPTYVHRSGESMEEARKQVLYGLCHCQILKISDNEIQWLTGEEDYSDGVNWIRERYQIPLILVSMGREGSRAYYNEMMVEVKPFLQDNTIETTGAGDTFCGCVLHYVCEHGINGLKRGKSG